MNAVISGRAGLGLVFDEQGTFLISVDTPEMVRVENPSSHLRLVEMPDARPLHNVTQEDALRALRQANLSNQALLFALIALDRTERKDWRINRIKALNSMVEASEVQDNVIERMCTTVLPEIADLKFAREVSEDFRNASHLFLEIDLIQPVVAECTRPHVTKVIDSTSPDVFERTIFREFDTDRVAHYWNTFVETRDESAHRSLIKSFAPAARILIGEFSDRMRWRGDPRLLIMGAYRGLEAVLGQRPSKSSDTILNDVIFGIQMRLRVVARTLSKEDFAWFLDRRFSPSKEQRSSDSSFNQEVPYPIFIEKFWDELSLLERLVFTLRVEFGMSYSRISRELGTTPLAVYEAYERLMRKFLKYDEGTTPTSDRDKEG